MPYRVEVSGALVPNAATRILRADSQRLALILQRSESAEYRVFLGNPSAGGRFLGFLASEPQYYYWCDYGDTLHGEIWVTNNWPLPPSQVGWITVSDDLCNYFDYANEKVCTLVGEYHSFHLVGTDIFHDFVPSRKRETLIMHGVLGNTIGFVSPSSMRKLATNYYSGYGSYNTSLILRRCRVGELVDYGWSFVSIGPAGQNMIYSEIYRTD